MRVSEQELKCREAGFRKVEAGGFELTPFAKLTLDVLDHRRRVAELEAQLAEARRDGERYRHIRTEAMIVRFGRRTEDKWKISWPFIAAPKQYVYDNYRERFDAAIDAAAAAAEGEKG